MWAVMDLNTEKKDYLFRCLSMDLRWNLGTVEVDVNLLQIQTELGL